MKYKIIFSNPNFLENRDTHMIVKREHSLSVARREVISPNHSVRSLHFTDFLYDSDIEVEVGI